MMTYGDLFAGIGGFALAAQWCGIKTYLRGSEEWWIYHVRNTI